MDCKSCLCFCPQGKTSSRILRSERKYSSKKGWLCLQAGFQEVFAEVRSNLEVLREYLLAS